MSYVTKTGKSENAAIQHITKNPKKFLNRYDKVKESTTLHRQFLRAKKVFEESDHITGLLLLSRDQMIKHEINFHSAEAERKRGNQITQKSVPHKNA